MERPLYRADTGRQGRFLKFKSLSIQGAFTVEADRQSDGRGSFGRVFCAREFRKMGLKHRVCQTNLSFNVKRGVLRGMHYQKAPYAEAKLVSCLSGRIYDVILDLRKGTGSFGKWCAVELSSDKALSVYIPEGCAHGFQTLESQSAVFYHMFSYYKPASSAGVRYNDPRFRIRWPLKVTGLSDKDKQYPDHRG